jgi:hypothetical protein
VARIPDEIIQQIRDRVDLVDLVGRFVTLKKAGRNYKGLCPFHGEKTPSFNVSPDRQGFYCFGCQEGGNAITFLMKIENLSFPEAARALAAERGIEIPETDSRERGLAERLYEANEVAQAAYRAALAAPGNPALAYLTKRGTAPPGIERFGIGFAPDRWDTVAGAARARHLDGLGERAGIRRACVGATTTGARAGPPDPGHRGRIPALAAARSARSEPSTAARSPIFLHSARLRRWRSIRPPRRAGDRRRGLLRSGRAAPRGRRSRARHLRNRAQRRACARPAPAHEDGGAAVRRR